MIDKKKYPLSVVEDIASLLQKFYPLEYKYSDIFEMNFNEIHLVDIKEKGNPSFKFIVSTPHQNQQKNTVFNVTFFPKSEHTFEQGISYLELQQIINRFDSWVSIVQRYNTISLSKEELNSKAEEKEFYDEFEIQENDSDISPLSVKNQIKVYKLLENLQERLKDQEETEPRVRKIIEDTEVLKNDLSNLPQSVVGKRIAKLQVQIKKVGMKFFLDVIDVAYKEAIKFALQGGIDSIHHLLN